MARDISLQLIYQISYHSCCFFLQKVYTGELYWFSLAIAVLSMLTTGWYLFYKKRFYIINTIHEFRFMIVSDNSLEVS